VSEFGTLSSLVIGGRIGVCMCDWVGAIRIGGLQLHDVYIRLIEGGEGGSERQTSVPNCV
jgi:hypothetical protein